jgi:hypothetical protein
MTVAENTNGRFYGEVYVSDGDSGDHSFIRISWLRSYIDSNFVVISVGGHGKRITGVRVIRDNDSTYGNKKLQVYVTTSSRYYVSVIRPYNTDMYSIHSIVTPIIQDSISGYVEQGKVTGLNSATFAAQGDIKVGENTVWHSGNFNPSSKLDVTAKAVDADKLDGYDSSYFATASSLSSHTSNTSNPHNVTAAQLGASNILTQIKTVDGSGSGLDADLLDGKHASSFANASHTHTASNISDVGKETISTSTPSGGTNGDKWFQV